jgi:hypothetical protein
MTTDTHYAYSTITNEIVHVDDVPNGDKCNCVCLDCNKSLIAKHGKHNTHHFSHIGDSNCNGGGETLLHLLTKEVISENKNFFIPNIIIKPDILSNQYGYPKLCNNDFKKEFFGEFYKIKEIKLEQQISNIQPDIISKLIYDNKEYELLIEIAVTHFIVLNGLNKRQVRLCAKKLGADESIYAKPAIAHKHSMPVGFF